MKIFIKCLFRITRCLDTKLKEVVLDHCCVMTRSIRKSPSLVCFPVLSHILYFFFSPLTATGNNLFSKNSIYCLFHVSIVRTFPNPTFLSFKSRKPVIIYCNPLLKVSHFLIIWKQRIYAILFVDNGFPIFNLFLNTGQYGNS